MDPARDLRFAAEVKPPLELELEPPKDEQH
jgi:hypothetical protein